MAIMTGWFRVVILDLSKRLSNSGIIIYKDAGHGGICQYHEEFVKSTLEFLAK